MTLLDTILFGLALSLDAFAVAITIGLCNDNTLTSFVKWRFSLIIGIFHFVMPLLGWTLGHYVQNIVKEYDHWIAFLLLLYIGGKMCYEGISSKGSEPKCSNQLSVNRSLILAIAVSIDAVIVGLSFGLINLDVVKSGQFINILVISFIIGTIATLVTRTGFQIGNRFSSKLGPKSEIIGGIILILIGLKTLLEHI